MQLDTWRLDFPQSLFFLLTLAVHAYTIRVTLTWLMQLYLCLQGFTDAAIAYWNVCTSELEG